MARLSSNKSRPDDPPEYENDSRSARLRKWWIEHATPERIQKWKPLTASSILALVSMCFECSSDQFSRIVINVLPVAVSVGAVLAGFQATALTIMLTLFDSETMQYLRKLGKTRDLHAYHASAIQLLTWFISIAFSFIALHWLGFGIQSLGRVGIAILVFFGTWSFMATARVIRIIVVLIGVRDDDLAKAQDRSNGSI